MMTWQNKPAFWFNDYLYEYNQSQKHQFYDVFDTSSTLGTRGEEIVPDSFNITNYESNFITSVPEGAVLFFTEESKYPRTKVKSCKRKRCIKASKAHYIVVSDKATLGDATSTNVYVFETIDKAFLIEENVYEKKFGKDLDLFKQNSYNKDFQKDATNTFVGKVKGFTRTKSYEDFTNGVYTKPFILDSDLDICLNSTLPDLTKSELSKILDLFNSEDIANHMLGFRSCMWFNYTKLPKTFKTLLYSDVRWMSQIKVETVEQAQFLRSLNVRKHRLSYSYYKFDTKLFDEFKTYIDSEDDNLARYILTRSSNFKQYYKNYARYMTNYSGLPKINDDETI